MPALSSSSRIETFEIPSPELETTPRTIRVYLPPGYDPAGQAYPVLYLHDGQNLFEPGAFGDWQADEILDGMVERGITRGLIGVGIDNSPQRWNEYSPWQNRHMHAWVDPERANPVEGGEGDRYLDFLVRSLKPEIDRRFRTLPGRENTAVGGSSMGGLISLYAGLSRPQVFSKVLAMSPAVWFAEGGGAWLARNQLIAYIRGHPVPAGSRFYLDVGTDERSREREPDVTDRQGQPLTYPQAYVEGCQAAADALAAAGVPRPNLLHVVDPQAVHHESAWAARLEPALTWLFQDLPAFRGE